MGQPAARVGDMHACPMATPGLPPIPHVGGPILPPGCTNVWIGGPPSARIGDQAMCVGPPDVIVKGAMPVLIGNQPAARLGDQTAHGGVILAGCITVTIGLAGTVGNVAAGIAACRRAAQGRASGSTAQTNNNCGIESARQVINEANHSNIDENTLFTQSINAGRADGPATTDGGATVPSQVEDIMAANGVSSSIQENNFQNLGTALGQGRGVITAAWAGDIWPGQPGIDPATLPAPGTGGHAIMVIGMEYDASGRPTTIIFNDTGTGNCGVRINADTFMNSARDRDGQYAGGVTPGMNVTDNPIW